MHNDVLNDLLCSLYIGVLTPVVFIIQVNKSCYRSELDFLKKNDAVNATAIATTKAPGDWPSQMSSKFVGPIMREGIAVV